jgi:hypothetical protein
LTCRSENHTLFSPCDAFETTDELRPELPDSSDLPALMSKIVQENGVRTTVRHNINSALVLRRFLIKPEGRLLVVSACSASKRFDVANPTNGIRHG